MADEIHAFTATIPAGTPQSSLYVKKFPLGLYVVDQIDLEVPPGPAGLMGFYLAITGQQWIPWEAGQFFTWDNQQASYPVANQPNVNGWELHGYNTGTYDHSVTVRFHVTVEPAPNVVLSPPTITLVTQPLAGSTVTL